MKKIIELIVNSKSFLKNIFILLILCRLLFIETDQLFLIAEILGSVILIINGDNKSHTDIIE